MGILLWALFGLIAGAMAKLLMPGKAPGGILVTIALVSLGRSSAGTSVRTLGLETLPVLTSQHAAGCRRRGPGVVHLRTCDQRPGLRGASPARGAIQG
jgi:uncharacterized membrane protein YeaQ/YmgE (transglycosylase-associated protein family)